MSNGGAQDRTFGPFFDDDGAIYRGIKVLVTDTGTTNAKRYWTDEAKTSAVNSGVLTDSDNDGIARAYFDGDYRFRVTQSNDSALDTAIDWDTNKVTSDTATMWEGNLGTTYPTAAAKNIFQQFLKVDNVTTPSTAEIGINMGSSFITLSDTITDDLNGAITAIGATDTTIKILTTLTLTSNLTIPSNVTLDFSRSGIIASGGYTLTVNGQINAGVHQIFSGFSSGEVTFGAGYQENIKADWWGTASGVIQLSVASVGTTGIPIILNPGVTYSFSSTLTITNIYTTMISSVENSLVRGASLPGQPPILNYTGTGTGLLVGSAPDVDGVYLEGIRLEGFQLRVTENTTKAMRVWHPLSSTFKNITIFGNSDLDSAGTHIGLETCATQDTSFENIDINGEGVSQTAVAAEYVNKGIFFTTGFGGTVSTTTDYKRVYVRRAITGYDMITDGNTYDCIAEVITTNTLTASNSVPGHTGTWQNFWCESTPNIGQVNGSKITFINGHFDIGTAQTFMDSLQGGAQTTFDDCKFVSSHATPLFMDTAQWASSPVQFKQCKFPTAFQIGATEAGGYDDIKITDMDIVIYRFTTNLAAVNTTYNCDVIDIGSGETEYYLPTSGNILGFLTHYYGAYTANTYTVTVKYDGGAITDLTIPTLSADESRKINYLTQPTVEKHYIEVDVTTAVGFETVGDTMVVDVIVALGDDGLA